MVGTESEAFDAILKERMIKNVPKRMNKRVMNEPEGVDRHMPQSEVPDVEGVPEKTSDEEETDSSGSWCQ